jgi:hypothetical protein
MDEDGLPISWELEYKVLLKFFDKNANLCYH